MKRKYLLTVAVCLFLGILTACGAPVEEEPTNTLDIPDVTPVPTVTVEPEESETPSPSPTPTEQITDLASLWETVEGVWSNGTENFVMFYEENGSQYFNDANWYSEFPRSSGCAQEMTALTDTSYRISLYYTAEEIYDGEWVDELVTAITVDLGESGDNKISVQIDNGIEIEYTFAGSTFEQAQTNLGIQ